MCSAATLKAGPINANELTRRLGVLAKRGEVVQSRFLRSPTESPVPEENNTRLETFCHEELVKSGGRPVVPLELLLHTAKGAEVGNEKLQMWLGDTKWGRYDGDVPPVFSTQLEDWRSFQHKWQWDNRGKIAGEEGFSAHLEWDRKYWLHRGHTKSVADPTFEETTRNGWEKHEIRYLETSGEEGFTAYTQAVVQRLASHNFTRPFQLLQDPRQQDPWTTWVEYLNYVYWWRDHHAAAMKTSERRYRKAWEELLQFDESASKIMKVITAPLEKELAATRDELLEGRNKVRKFVNGTRAFRRGETGVRVQDQRAQWVLEQLPMVETTPSPENEAARNDLTASGGKTRKLVDDSASLARQQPKRKRHKLDQGDSNHDPEPEMGKKSDPLMADERAATSTTATRAPRSRKRRHPVGDAAAAALPPRRKAAERRTRRAQEHSLGSTASSWTSRLRKRNVNNVTT